MDRTILQVTAVQAHPVQVMEQVVTAMQISGVQMHAQVVQLTLMVLRRQNHVSVLENYVLAPIIIVTLPAVAITTVSTNITVHRTSLHRV